MCIGYTTTWRSVWDLHNRGLKAWDSLSPLPAELRVQLIRYTQKLILIGWFHLPGDGYEIYSPQIEQSDWIVWKYHGTNMYNVYRISCYRRTCHIKSSWLVRCKPTHTERAKVSLFCDNYQTLQNNCCMRRSGRASSSRSNWVYLIARVL